MRAKLDLASWSTFIRRHPSEYPGSRQLARVSDPHTKG